MSTYQRRLLPWLAVAVLLGAVLSSCGSQPEPEQPQDPAQLEPISLSGGEKLNVIATTNIVGDVVRIVSVCFQPTNEQGFSRSTSANNSNLYRFTPVVNSTVGHN